MALTPQDWHQRFTQQAQWTRDLRDYLFGQIKIEKAHRILEVGCGTGAILAELPGVVPLQVGLDINRSHLETTIRNSIGASLTQGDAHTLPYPDGCYDLSYCHFLLLWVADPIQVAREMARVTRPGGAVMAFAEPDYGARIDYPATLSQLGVWQTSSLREQGADPLIGRKLAGIFYQAGLQTVQSGVLGGQWSGPPDWDHWESEWAVLESDLNKTSKFINISEVSKLKDVDRSAYERGERVLFVPTFYAWGRVPSSAR